MSSDEVSESRRKWMQGTTASLVASVAIPAVAQNAGATDVGDTAPHDPRMLYPHAPFPQQHQPWPGLAGRMTPRPDHGERSYRGSGRLDGRKALITGGDSGIGRAAAIAFAREGADVAIAYLPDEEPDAREVVQYIRSAGRKAVPLPVDIRTEAACGKLVEQAVAGLGGLDILVNNAARQQSHDSILDISTEQFDWTLRTNLYALFWITRAAIPHMPPGSAIVNTTSVNAYDPSANLLDYAMTKAAIANFTKGLAKQMIQRGIRVNGVAPGPFWTPLQVSGGQTEKNVETFGQQVPMGRPGQPAELASIYVELASSRASYVTGQIYGASGGAGQP
ncbi:SDR family oxidoreductase [Burkholderia vietnamiensis]|uniref:SDR family oxidoreductase n=1 Tax=Burkholderia vietnamiensis TaxID=60552 RepID=UPI00158B0025|nr:SDR family oxidoreductase [Burkholderia vietnamiensis]MBR8084983.1 SDR family oxidoreductase [Burkholderia vietnamiensis]MCA7944477.1 SDR family oxidoreductase [Burkholderia vietnamiensis]HDR8972750.1 SDR family oxidoreductase [Burkholderia vietnamiensis]HDR9037255.1 SDR family oxidoreductase [Burkholderia vietnamiensis]HDR9143965.1 SDR family oxidoreductase [Burkholderia vietnamiensis]